MQVQVLSIGIRKLMITINKIKALTSKSYQVDKWMKLYFDAFYCKVPSFIHSPDYVRKTTFFITQVFDHDVATFSSWFGPWDVIRWILGNKYSKYSDVVFDVKNHLI